MSTQGKARVRRRTQRLRVDLPGDPNKEARTALIAKYLTRIREILDVGLMRCHDGYAEWRAFAAVFAVRPEEPWNLRQLHEEITELVAKQVATGWVVLDLIRVMNLLDETVWIADRAHEPSTWPPRDALKRK